MPWVAFGAAGIAGGNRFVLGFCVRVIGSSLPEQPFFVWILFPRDWLEFTGAIVYALDFVST